MAIVERRFPEWLRHTPDTGARTFAILGGIESCARAVISSVLPLTAYRALGDAAGLSLVYMLVGVASLIAALVLPSLGHYVRRRFLYTAGALCIAVAATFGGLFEGRLVLAALFAQAIGTVTITVCFNAYLMDYIQRTELGSSESLRLFYSASAWTIGPFLGVWLMDEVHPASPFALSFLAAVILIAAFWYFRLGDGKAIARAMAPAPNPITYLRGFFRRPRLIAGWLFASIRSCGWVAFYLYVPIFAVEAGFGEKAGGLMVSLAAVYMFVTPLMLRWTKRHSVRQAVMIGFGLSAAGWISACLMLPASALLTAVALQLAALFMVMLDVVGGLPFLMAVKPSERTEMSAVYSTFRDVANIATPAIGSLVLLILPLSGMFAAIGGLFVGATLLANTLPAKLGAPRRPASPSSIPPQPFAAAPAMARPLARAKGD